MTAWLCSKNRKRHQRAMNKIVRQMNKNVERDDLWKGRFYARQVDSAWRIYEDKSGAELIVTLRFYDKVTGITKDWTRTVNEWRMWDGHHLWWKMNDFIVEDVRVWERS